MGVVRRGVELLDFEANIVREAYIGVCFGYCVVEEVFLKNSGF